MADIELVIKIPEGIMEYIKNNDCLAVAYGDEVAKAIKNGTPLPKGHGKLKDVERLLTVIHRDTVGDLFDQLIDMQPTIIDADKE